MKLIKCDTCGKEITYDCQNIVSIIGLKGRYDRKSEEFDLCDECYSKLKKMFEKQIQVVEK